MKYGLLVLTVFVTSFYFAQNRLKIEDITVIPMHIKNTWTHKDVIIENGEIINIRNHQEKDKETYDKGVISGVDKFLIPSFADAHAVLPDWGLTKNYFLLNILNGVTTLRSMKGEDWQLKINQEYDFTPRLILSSPPITKSDSLSVQQARDFIKNAKNLGYNFTYIENINDENSFLNLVIQAKSNFHPLSGQIPEKVGLTNIINADAYKSIEHLNAFYRYTSMKDINEAVEISVENGVYFCPTLDYLYTYIEDPKIIRARKGVEWVSPLMKKGWDEEIEYYYINTDEEKLKERAEEFPKLASKNRGLLAYMYYQGAKLLLSPNSIGFYGIPGFRYIEEMKHYEQSDISNHDILKAACYNLSVMNNTENEWGTIKVGSKSDLLILGSNPLLNIRNASNIEGIILKGKYFTPDDIKKELKKTLID